MHVRITDSRHITIHLSQQLLLGLGDMGVTAGLPRPQTLTPPQMVRAVRPSPCSPS